MATLDGGGVYASGTDALDGGGASTTDTTTNPYGVTVQQVRELASHVGFDPALDDPDFGPTKKQITDAMVAHWIGLVTESVAARTALLSRFQGQHDRWVAITGSARAAVTNGAAAYLVSAAYPSKAGTNDQSSYSAELWKRYETELGMMLDLGTQFDKDDAAGVGPSSTAVLPRASYTPPRVPRGNGFFPTESPLTYPHRDPNRSWPAHGTYPPAPGAEGGY